MDVNFLEYLSLVKAIPKAWLKRIVNNDCDCVSQVSNVMDKLKNNVMKLKSKKIYWKYLEKIVRQPSAIQHWISEFPFFHDNDFAEIFSNAYNTGDVKLQSFQYKILNRIFACNYMLNKWGIANSAKCTYCEDIDTLEHYFYYCEHCQEFWKGITQWFAVVYQVNIPLKIVDILMGISHRRTQDDTLAKLNFVVLQGKWYIYTCKKESKALTFVGFKKYFKYCLKIEKEVSVRKNEECAFQQQWQDMLCFFEK